jgi:hypothetical protein
MPEILEGIQSGSAQLKKKTPPNIGEGSKLINVIVKELVLVPDTGRSMNVFLIHVRNLGISSTCKKGSHQPLKL